MTCWQRFAIGPTSTAPLDFGPTQWHLLLYTTLWFDWYPTSALGTNLMHRNLAFLVLAYIPQPQKGGALRSISANFHSCTPTSVTGGAVIVGRPAMSGSQPSRGNS